MAKPREYLLTIDSFNRPVVVEDKEAVATLIMRLLLLNPGSDPLHPEMGVGLINYRFALNKEEELQHRVDTQLQTYLPDISQNAIVEIKKIEPDKLCNIEITIDDITYIYDSKTAPIPISLESIATL